MNKEDLKQIKTIVKDEIGKATKNLATKAELRNLATKTEIKNLATKDYVKDEIGKATKNLATKDEILDLRLTMDRKLNNIEQKIEKGMDKMLAIATDIAGKFDHFKQENAMSAGIEHRQDEQLQSHEIRIQKLETLQK